MNPSNNISIKSAYSIIDNCDQKQIALLRQALFIAVDLPGLKEWCYDADEVLSKIRKVFSPEILVADIQLETLITSANQAREQFLKAKPSAVDSLDGYDEVRAIIHAVLAVLPAEEECLKMLWKCPAEILVPFLILAFNEKNVFTTNGSSVRSNFILHFLIHDEFAENGLAVFKEYITHANPTRCEFGTAVSGARKALKEGFDEWYQDIRGASYTEDIRIHREIERQDNENRRWRRDGYYCYPAVNVGKITGEIRSYSGTDISLLLVINRPCKQTEFERYLKELGKIICLFRPTVTLIFTRGGTLIIPDWFREFCKENDIEIVVED